MTPRAPRPAPPAPAMLIVCALGIERFALGRGARTRRSEPASAATVPRPPTEETFPRSVPATLVRTGMGPRAARRAVARALRDEPVPGATAVAAAGFCAGLVPGMRPGDIVLAEATRDEHGHTRCTAIEPLARALAPLGTVHTGTLAGSDHVVRGAERAALQRTGAVAVDMESAATLGAAVRGMPGRPVTAVRVVVDAPGHELVRIGTVRGGISAFRALTTLLPALLAWHRSLPLSRR